MKLARKYDPEGDRTLGVVTKCDDAAKAESSDIVEKARWTLADLKTFGWVGGASKCHKP